MRLIQFLGRRPLTYSKEWMVATGYTWLPGETIPVHEEDAHVLVTKCATDFVDKGEAPAEPEKKSPVLVREVPGDPPEPIALPSSDVKPVCSLCGKTCKSAAGLTLHMKTCKGAVS